MDAAEHKFISAVVGSDGARALAKVGDRAPELGAAIFPRVVWAWLSVASRADFEGQIPGSDNSYLEFKKSEDRYSGSVAIGEDVYSFDSASLFHLGACVAVAIGADHQQLSPGLRDLDIQRLGKNVDTLVKARMAVAELQKRARISKASIPNAGKEAPGPAAAAQAPQEPQGPLAPVAGQTSKGPVVSLRPKAPKLPTPSASTDQVQTGASAKAPKVKAPTLPGLKVTKAQAETKCPACSGKQFQDNQFVGCVCFKALSKGVRVETTDTGYLLEFDADWQKDSVLTLIESLGKE